MSAGTLLHVEDNELNRKLVRGLLKATSYRLIEPNSGEAGVATTLVARPELILMDIPLPRISGIETIRPLRTDPGTADTPIIAVTSFLLFREEQKARDAGAHGLPREAVQPA